MRQDIPSMEKSPCPRCLSEIDRVDRFCRYCGEQVRSVEGGHLVSIEVVPELSANRRSAMDSPWVVLSMIFFVLGPLALPMLWRGNAFSLRGKWIVTLLTVAYFFFLLWLTIFLANIMIFEPIRKALSFSH
jgi:hypothetical protein